MKTVNIRAYKASDLSLLIQILRLNTPMYFAPEEEFDFIKYLSSEIEQYFVIEYDGIVVGAGGINYFEDHARLSWDIINPEYHSEGLGTVLLIYRIDLIKKQNKYFTIIVRTSQKAYKYYEKKGFKLIETKANYWSLNLDLYKMKFDI